MTSQDLAEYIYNEAIDNPVIDMEELNISELREKINWLNRQSFSLPTTGRSDDERHKNFTLKIENVGAYPVKM